MLNKETIGSFLKTPRVRNWEYFNIKNKKNNARYSVQAH